MLWLIKVAERLNKLPADKTLARLGPATIAKPWHGLSAWAWAVHISKMALDIQTFGLAK